MFTNARNSLDVVKPIRQSITHSRFIDEDWIIAVEGTTDVAFYSRFVTESSIRIKPATKLENAHQKERDSRCLIIAFVKDKVQKGKHCYGIMDADYQLPEIDDLIRDYVIFTDENSLETMIVKYTGISKIEKNLNWKLIKQFCLNKPMIELALEFSFKIGRIRQENIKKNYYLKFKDVYNKSHNYLDFLSATKPTKILKNEKEKLEYDIIFNFDDYIKKIIEVSSVNKKIHLRSLIPESFSISESPWDKICQGHDIVYFMVAMAEIHRNISNDKRNTRSIEEKTRELENKIIKGIKPSAFYDSPIGKWLNKIQEEAENENP